MKKLVALVLTLALALTCISALAEFQPVAIGAKGNGTREYVAPPEGDWKTPYSEIVNITTVKGQGVDVVFEAGEDQTNNEWNRGWYNDLGIEVTYDWIDEGNTQYTQKLNMQIATGDLPDVFRVDYIQFRQLMKAGLIQDLTEVYNKYTSQRVRDYEKTDPDTIKLTTIDGKIYGIPYYYYGIIDNPKYMWIRQDWYKAEGSPEIKTIADFEALAHTFIDKYGTSYGISISNSLEELFMTGPMFDVYLGAPANSSYYWYPDETGRIKAGIAHPEFKTALKYWAKWYQEGIISPDFMNYDYNGMLEELAIGHAGMQPFYQWGGWAVGPNMVGAQGDNEAYMIPFQLPTEDGHQVKGQIGFPNGNVVVVANSCKNPAAVMKLLSYTDYIMFDGDTVLTDEQFHGFTDGQREHVPGAFEILDPQADMLQYEHVSEAMKTGDTSKLFTAGMQKKYADSIAWRDNHESGGLGAYLQQGCVPCAYQLAKELIDSGNIIKTSMWGPAPVEFDETVNTGDIISTGVMQIISGERPVDDYDEILKEWYAQGGQIMEDAVNAQYGGK